LLWPKSDRCSFGFAHGIERFLYLVAFVSEVPRKEKCERRWCGYDEALTLLSHVDASELSKKALLIMNDQKQS